MGSCIVVEYNLHFRGTAITPYPGGREDFSARGQRVNKHGQARCRQVGFLPSRLICERITENMGRILTFRISSKSSLNASATEAIQNFLNRSFNNCSCSCPPDGDRNDGVSEGGGVGDGVRRAGFRGVEEVATVGDGALGGSTSESLSESESESEDDDEAEDSSLGSG